MNYISNKIVFSKPDVNGISTITINNHCYKITAKEQIFLKDNVLNYGIEGLIELLKNKSIFDKTKQSVLFSIEKNLSCDENELCIIYRKILENICKNHIKIIDDEFEHIQNNLIKNQMRYRLVLTILKQHYLGSEKWYTLLARHKIPETKSERSIRTGIAIQAFNTYIKLEKSFDIEGFEILYKLKYISIIDEIATYIKGQSQQFILFQNPKLYPINQDKEKYLSEYSIKNLRNIFKELNNNEISFSELITGKKPREKYTINIDSIPWGALSLMENQLNNLHEIFDEKILIDFTNNESALYRFVEIGAMMECISFKIRKKAISIIRKEDKNAKI